MKTDYIWVVTYDHTDFRNVKVIGPNGAVEEDLSKCTLPFRMFDDDGVLYYEGKMSPNCDFEPLDDYGMPNAGCTEIKIKENTQWVTL